MNLARAAAASRRATRRFGTDPAVPDGFVTRSPLNTPSGAARLCTSVDVRLDDLKDVARRSGTTLNGTFHGVLALTLRAHFAAAGATPERPLVAAFGVAEKLSSTRFHGNAIATSRVWLHAEEADPRTALQRTGLSCTRAVELRRARGFDLHREAMAVIGRAFGTIRAVAAHRTPLITNHVTTANVPGPASTRWFGQVRATRLVSYSLAIAPADVNITAYSYAGSFTVGLVCTPESLPDPDAFLRLFTETLAGLRAELRADLADAVGTGPDLVAVTR